MRYYKLERTVEDVMVDLERVVCAQVMKSRSDERAIDVMFDNGGRIYVEFYTAEGARMSLNMLMMRLEEYRGNKKQIEQDEQERTSHN